MNWFKKIIQNFVCDHEYIFVCNIYGDEINQCGGYRSLWKCVKCGKYKYCKRLYSPLNKNLNETLNKFYDEYYENKQIDWNKNNEDFLNTVTNHLINAAANGNCYAEILMIDNETTNDKYYFEQWLIENKLDYSCQIYNQKEKYDEINQYKFEIRWK